VNSWATFAVLFTGAVQDKVGPFDHADGGTIFLDASGELSPAAQAKLLRVLWNRQVAECGFSNLSRDQCSSSRCHSPQSKRNKRNKRKEMVRNGEFREDLYYRLAIIEILLPALYLQSAGNPLF
jgi:Nif-specific regulatory protein